MPEEVDSVSVCVRYSDGTTQIWTGEQPRINRRNEKWDLMIAYDGPHTVETIEPKPPRLDYLSPDEWQKRFNEEYEEARDHGASKDSADSYAENHMRQVYGECPAGPPRPFGPWLNLVPASYDVQWHDDAEIKRWGPGTEPYPGIEADRQAILAAQEAGR